MGNKEDNKKFTNSHGFWRLQKKDNVKDPVARMLRRLLGLAKEKLGSYKVCTSTQHENNQNIKRNIYTLHK